MVDARPGVRYGCEEDRLDLQDMELDVDFVKAEEATEVFDWDMSTRKMHNVEKTKSRGESAFNAEPGAICIGEQRVCETSATAQQTIANRTLRQITSLSRCRVQ